MMTRKLALVVLLCVALFHCKSADDGLLDDTYARLVSASEVLENNRGNQKAAEAALMKLYQSHHEQILQYRKKADAMIASLPEDEQESYRKRMQGIRARLENLSRTYDKPIDIVRILALMY